MRLLDLERWPRRASFEHFRRLDNPYFNVCTRLDLTALVAAKAQLGGSLWLAYHHLLLRLANEIEAFRYRLEGGRVWVLDAVDASAAVQRDDGSIAFVHLPYDPDFARFAAAAAPRLQAVRDGRAPFDAAPDPRALLHFTTLPWIDFTSFSHARSWGRDDAVPKIAFGRLQHDGERHTMALAVEVHHALMDGWHVGQLVQGLEARLREPLRWLAAAPPDPTAGAAAP